MFRRRNGFTLIEVIVSIALLGIISLGFLGALNNNLNFLKINKSMTANAFLDQKDMELEILQTRLDIEGGVIPSGSLTTLEDVFETGIDVKAYQLKFPYNKQDIYTLVTDTRLPEFKVPIAENVKAQLRNNTTPVDFAYAVPETNVVGSSSIDPTTADVFMVNNYNWYASRPGFNIPMPDTLIPEIEVGNKYPKFPEDYSLIPTSTTINLNDVTKYAGRHIVFAVTPAAKSGKMGQTVPSKPVFISGLPVNGSNLVLHLDASTISDTDTSQVAIDGGELYVQKWNDLTTNKKNALQGTQSNRPKLKEHPVGGDFVGKYVDFDASKNLLVQHDSTRNTSLYVFAVVRGNNSDVFYNSNSKTNINGNDAEIIGVTGQWKIVYFQYNSPDHTDSNKITLGNSDVDVAELIVYKGTFTENNKNDVIKYLKEKYIPLAVVGKIVQLRPMTDVEVIKDSPYNLPFAVLAEMEYGSDRFVPVTWVPNAVNTSSLGTYTFTATYINDTTKTTTLNVIVKDIVNVSSISLNINNLTLQVGESFVLDSTILPVDATNKAITWESSNSSVASVSPNGFDSAEVFGVTPGTAVITVKTVDGNKTANCTVTVTPVPVDWKNTLILHLDASNTSSFDIRTSWGTNYIKSWNDISGNGNHFTQSTNNYWQPLLVSNGLSGNPIVKFDGSNDFLTLDSNSLTGSPDGEDLYTNDDNQFSIFMVSKTTGTNNNTFLSKSGGWGNSATYVFGRNSNGFSHVLRGTTTKNATGNDNFNLHTAIYYNKVHSYWLNGISGTNSTIGSAGNQTAQKIVLGATASGTSNFLNGDIAEVRIYNSALTEEQRKIVEKELKDKWLNIPVKEWNFDIATNGTDGWHTPQNIFNFRRESDSSIGSGVISGTILNGDPYFHSPGNLNIDTSEATKIVIRLKNNTASTMGQIYFRTSVGNTYDEARRINFPINPNSGYTDYEINVGSLASWTGTLNEFRIDPATDFTGSFSIDYVKIYK